MRKVVRIFLEVEAAENKLQMIEVSKDLDFLAELVLMDIGIAHPAENAVRRIRRKQAPAVFELLLRKFAISGDRAQGQMFGNVPIGVQAVP